MPRPIVGFLFAVMLLPGRVPAQDGALTGLRLPEGWKAEVVEGSAVARPRRIAFLEDGTPLVVEQGRNKASLQVLASSKPNGPWDRARGILEAEVIGDVLALDGWVYVAGSGGLRRLRPTRAGEPADAPVNVVTGLGGPPSGLRVAAGPDGWLYLSAAAGDHDARGADGSRARVPHTGAVFRCRPDGSRLEAFAVGLTEPGRVAFDSEGHAFVADGRLLHVAEGADFARLPPLVPDGKRGPAELAATPAGLLVLDPRRRAVRVYRLVPAGASFKVTEDSAFLEASADPHFAPSQIEMGPDGAVYLVDPRDGKQGRILRLSRSTGAARRPIGAALKDDELVRALSSETAGEREAARRELVRRGGKVRAALIRLLEGDDAPAAVRLAALGALQAMVNGDVLAALERMLAEGEPATQRVAAEMLGLYASRGDRSATDALAKALTSEDRAVRRAVALALGRVGGSGAADSLASALSFDDGSDAYLRDGLARGLERLGRPGIDALLSLANSGVQKDSDRVLEVFLTFRTRPAFDALVRLLENPHLSFKQRADLVASAGRYRLDPPVSLDPLLSHVEGHDGAADLRGAMLQALASSAVPLTTKGEAFAVATLSRKEAGNELRRSAIRVLARTASGSSTAGRLWLDGRVPGEFRKDVVAALEKHAVADAGAAKLLGELRKAGR